MMLRSLAIFFLGLATAGANPESGSKSSSAQAPLPTLPLLVNGHRLTAEVADDPQEQKLGLMFRTELAPDTGMLFVMGKPRRAAFWMKNTSVPLSIAYINQGGRILEIHDLEPHNEESVPSAFPNIAYALEMPQGWFRDKGILPGDQIKGLPDPRPQ